MPYYNLSDAKRHHNEDVAARDAKPKGPKRKRSRKQRIFPHDKAQIRRVYASGLMSLRELGKEYGVSHTRIHQIVKYELENMEENNNG